MKLSRLLKALERQGTQPPGTSVADAAGDATDVRGLSYDSRRVENGDLFIALKGLKTSGSEFAADAIRRGAAAVVADSPAPGSAPVPWVVVADAREAMAVLA